MGAEVTQMFTIDFGGAVLFTGGFYQQSVNGPTPDNLYEAFSRLQLEF